MMGHNLGLMLKFKHQGCLTLRIRSSLCVLLMVGSPCALVHASHWGPSLQDVLKRILGAIIFRKDLFSEVEASPDLYGPFWLSTTAIFLMAMISNALDWLAERTAWEGDLEKIAYGATILYGYVFGGGFLLWVWLKVISLAQISLVALWCIYGALVPSSHQPSHVLSAQPCNSESCGCVVMEFNILFNAAERNNPSMPSIRCLLP